MIISQNTNVRKPAKRSNLETQHGSRIKAEAENNKREPWVHNLKEDGLPAVSVRSLLKSRGTSRPLAQRVAMSYISRGIQAPLCFLRADDPRWLPGILGATRTQPTRDKACSPPVSLSPEPSASARLMLGAGGGGDLHSLRSPLTCSGTLRNTTLP